tara:strand:- start:1560 stop:2375 length:816 start_codon:yes stop_codon:yes gene_type:complete
MIKQAIIPLAGLGTRLLPFTTIIPKELLPINGKTGIEYIIDECIEAGIKEIIFVISKKKEMIKHYFYKDNFYKKVIKNKKDKRIEFEYKKIKKYRKMIKFVYQNIPKGTGDAVLKCMKYIKGNHFIMMFPDDLIVKKNCTRDMIKVHKKFNCSVMASMQVKKSNVNRWGIYSINRDIDKSNFLISDVIEKPEIKESPSKNAVIGRYILPKIIFKKLKKQSKGKGGEIHITDSIRSLIKENTTFIGHKFKGKYLDCGTMNGYIKSSIEISKL